MHKIKFPQWAGYNEFIDDSGSTIFVDKDTGEVIEGISRIVPDGSLCLSPKQLAAQKAYKERGKILKQQEKALGPYIYAAASEQTYDGLSAETIARAAYLGTFADFDTGELWRTRRSKIKRKELPEVMRISSKTADRFWSDVNNRYFFRDEEGYLHTIGNAFSKGNCLLRRTLNTKNCAYQHSVIYMRRSQAHSTTALDMSYRPFNTLTLNTTFYAIIRGKRDMKALFR